MFVQPLLVSVEFVLELLRIDLHTTTPFGVVMLQMLKQMWPFVGDYVKDLLKTQWEESLRSTMAGYKLNNFKFEKIFLGDIVS